MNQKVCICVHKRAFYSVYLKAIHVIAFFLVCLFSEFTATALGKHFRACDIWMNDVKTNKRFWFMAGCVLDLVKTPQHMIFWLLMFNVTVNKC